MSFLVMSFLEADGPHHHPPHAWRAAIALVGADAMRLLRGALLEVWARVSAWSATLLFCCQPIAQLAACFAAPAAAASLNVSTVCLGMVGNGLMLPRALLTRDPIWIVGTVWGTLAMGWASLAAIARAGSLTGCGRSIPSPPPASGGPAISHSI